MKKKVKILHLRSSGALLGAENVILEIAKGSPRFGFCSIIGALNNVQDPKPDFINAAAGYGLQTILFQHFRFIDLNCARAIRMYVKNNNIKILHLHGYKEDFFGILSRCNVPIISTNHLWKKTTPKLKVYRLLDILLLHFINQIVGVSDELVHEMQRLGIKNVQKIPNGIDIERFSVQHKSLHLIESLNISSDTIVLGMVSSLTPEKNHQMVIHCLEKLRNPNLKLLIVGDGPQKTALQKIVQEKGLRESVIFMGMQKNIPEILSVIDIYLLPSLTEGLPMSLLEAMASGKAVIASRVGEIPNVVIHGQNGLLFDPKNFHEFLECINFYLQKKHLIYSFSIMAQKTITERFSSNIMVSNYSKLYSKMLLES